MTTNILLSYAMHARTDLADIRRRMTCGQLMIDSGAFTAHTKGREVDVDEYADYLTRWKGQWTHAVTLDKIGDPAASRRNTRRLLDRGLAVMPVFTRGETLPEFDAMVRECRYVCVGGGIGMSISSVLARIRLLQRRAQDLGGGVHALGMGAISHLQKARPYSGDSSNSSGSFQYGRVRAFNGRNIQTIEARNTPKLRQHWQLLRDHGIDVGILGRTGRIPGGADYKLMHKCSFLADTCADEWLRSVITVPPPHPGLPPGPHVYSALGNGANLTQTATGIDRDLHNGYNPPVWERYGKRHDCPAMHHPEVVAS